MDFYYCMIMENFNAKKLHKDSGVSRVVESDEVEEKKLLQLFKDLFESQQIFQLPEKEKTPFFKGLVHDINERMQKFVAEYGGTGLDVEDKHIHLADLEKFTPEQRDFLKNVAAIFMPRGQGVVVWNYDEKNKIKLATILAHELLHFNSFFSYQKDEDISQERIEDLPLVITTNLPDQKKEIMLRMRRGGFRIRTKGKEVYFRKIDEAIIEELTTRFGAKYFPQLNGVAQELEEKNQSLKLLSPETREKLISEHTYDEERQKLNELIDDLYIKNMGSFKSREGVFALFARAVLTGRLLPIARLIEKTNGKGSFRVLGAETN